MSTFPALSRFTGRAEELDIFVRRLPDRTHGRGAVLAIAGEAGMGKSRLLAEYEQLAGQNGALPLHGQMSEMPAVPPYFHWLLLLRGLLSHIDRCALESLTDAHRRALRALLPEVEESGAQETPIPNPDDRFHLYDAVTRLLLNAAAEQPLVLLLDNLHLADRSSLDLLEYLAQHVADHPLLLVAAYREPDFQRGSPLRALLQRVAQLSNYIAIKLEGLTSEEVAEMLYAGLGQAASASLLEKVCTRSGGNPLYVSEMTRMLGQRDGGRCKAGLALPEGVPESLREVVNRRLDALARSTCDLLGIGAIFGREFAVDGVASLSGSRVEFVNEAMQQAERTGIIAAGSDDSLYFTHTLYREVLYAEHATLRRRALHGAAAAYIESQHANDLPTHFSSLAYHNMEAATPEHARHAVRYCRKAAQTAMARRAYQEASALLENALQAAEMERESTPRLRFELLSELAQAQYYSGDLSPAAETLVEAAHLTHEQAWWEELAGILCFFQLLCQQSGSRYPAAISLHQAVLDNLPESDLALRARVHSSLAKAYRTEGEPALAAQAYDRGISLARKSGDKSALLECMRKGNWTVGRRPDMIRSGLEICREAHQLAADLGKPQYQLDTRVDTIFQLCDLGEIDEVTHHISVLAREVSLHRQSHFFNVLVGFQASLAILQGRWRDAMEYAHTGVIQVPHQGVRGLEGRFGFQIFAINKMQGKLGEFAEIAASIIASTPEHQLWLPGEILLYCELEQHDEARRALDRLGDVYRMPDDDLRPIALVYLAEACTRLQDHARCEQLHRLLIPYRHLNATIPGTLMLGAMSGYLAKLCMQLNRHLEAGDFLDHAIELNSRMKAYPALAQNLVDYSELLLRQGIEDVSDRIGKMLSTARDHAERLELRPLLDQIATLETRDPSASLTPRECDILRLVAAGTSNKRIAGELHISYSTVATHLRNILRKAGATNRTEAVNWARKSHILD